MYTGEVFSLQTMNADNFKNDFSQISLAFQSLQYVKEVGIRFLYIMCVKYEKKLGRHFKIQKLSIIREHHMVDLTHHILGYTPSNNNIAPTYLNMFKTSLISLPLSLFVHKNVLHNIITTGHK